MKKILLIIVLKLVNIISANSTSSDRFFPFDGFAKCHITTHECPNKNITFHLYTTESQSESHQLDVATPETIKQANFMKGKPLIILIHGYTGHKDFSPNIEIRPAYLKHGNYNVISVDYHPLAPEPCYVQAVQNLPTVANCTAQLIDYLIKESIFPLDSVHVIGFSLGAQTAGMVGSNIKSGKLKRITGLDPAKPLFIFANSNGILTPAGHADFYVNGGLEQPGCRNQREMSPGSCNHVRAPIYYAESINSEKGFWGYKCKDWMRWAFGLCHPASSDELALMGAHVSQEANGIYFLKANSETPYAQGVVEEFSNT